MPGRSAANMLTHCKNPTLYAKLGIDNADVEAAIR
jgi:hypothetical protein